MTAALSDGGFQGRRALHAPSIQGIPKLVAPLGSSGALRTSIRPPVKAWPFENWVPSISSKSKFLA
jgi:hypothetical protein